MSKAHQNNHISENRKKNAERNIIYGILNKLLNLGFPFVMRTILIYKLGLEYTGLNGVFTSLLGVLSLAELGIGSAMVYEMYKPVAAQDDKKVCALLNLYRKLYRIIGLVILTAGLLLVPFLQYFIKGSYPDDINLYLVYALFLFNTVISYFLYAYKQSVLIAWQRRDILSKTAMLINSFMYIAQIAVIFIFQNYYYYLILLPVFTIINNLVNNALVNRLYPQYSCYGSISPDEKSNIKKNVFALVGTKMSAVVHHSSDNLVISAFIGLSAVTVYGNYYFIISSVVAFVDIIYSSMTAGIGNSLITESAEKNYADYTVLNSFNAWMIGWCCSCILTLSQPFIRLWVGERLMLPLDIVILLTVYFFAYVGNKINLTYKDSAGIWWQDRYRPYVVMITNLGLNLFLVQFWGLSGVVFSTIVSLLIGWMWSAIVLYKSLFKRELNEILIFALKTFAKCVCVCSISFVICEYVQVNGIISLAARFIVCSVVSISSYYLLSIREKDFKAVCTMLKNIIINKRLAIHR